VSVRNVVLTVLFSGVVFLSAFAGPSCLPDSERVAIEKTLQTINDEIVRAAESLEVEKMFSFIRDDAEGVMIRNGRLILTKDEAYRTYRQGVQNLRRLEYRFDRTVIHILSRDLALFLCEGVATGTTGEGNTFRVPFAQTTVYGLRDGAWKVLHVHASVPSR